MFYLVQKSRVAITKGHAWAVLRWGNWLSTPPTAYISASRILRSTGDLAASEALLGAGRAHHPSDLALAQEFAKIAVAQQNWPEAARRWQVFLEQFGKAAPVAAYAALAQAHRLSKDIPDAEAALARGVRLHGKSLPFAIEAAKITAADLNWPVAAARWRIVLDEYAADAPSDAYVGLSIACRRQGKYPEAEAAIESARTHHKKSIPIEMEWAEIATDRRNWTEAISRWHALLDLEGVDQSETKLRLGLVHRMCGDGQAAKAYFDALPTPIPIFEGYGPVEEVINPQQDHRRTARGGSLCVHLHLFHRSMFELFAEKLRLIPRHFTLVVSLPAEADLAFWEREFATAVPRAEQLIISPVTNRGRDVLPWMCIFRDVVQSHDLLLHLHTKLSGGSKGLLWSEFLLNSVLGSEAVVHRILQKFEDEELGLVYPPYFRALVRQPNWGKNRGICDELYRRLFREPLPGICPDYPAGSFFWARSSYLRPLFDLHLTEQDFPPEIGQVDETLAHAIERVIGTLDRHTHLRKSCVAAAARLQPSATCGLGEAEARESQDGAKI